MGYVPYGFPARVPLSESTVVALEPLILAEATYLLVVTADAAVLWTTGPASKRLGGYERGGDLLATQGNHIGAAWRPDGALVAIATSKGHVIILACPPSGIGGSSPLHCLAQSDVATAVPDSGGLTCVAAGDLSCVLGTTSGLLVALSWLGAVVATRPTDAPLLPGTPVLSPRSVEVEEEEAAPGGRDGGEGHGVVSLAYDVGSHRLVCVTRAGNAVAFAFENEAPPSLCPLLPAGCWLLWLAAVAGCCGWLLWLAAGWATHPPSLPLSLCSSLLSGGPRPSLPMLCSLHCLTDLSPRRRRRSSGERPADDFPPTERRSRR